MKSSASTPAARRANLTVPWLVIVLVLLLAIILSVITRGGNTLAIDRETTSAVQQLDGQPWRGIAQLGNALGESTYAITVAVILLVLSVVRRDLRDIAFLCVLLILRTAATMLKEIFDSPRPTLKVAEVLEAFDNFGFPSGHAMTSATALGGVAFIAARRVSSHGRGWGIAVAWLLGMAMTGFARIWVGAHWLTDVAGGSLYGIAIVLIAANVSAIIAAWSRERRDRQAGVVRS